MLFILSRLGTLPDSLFVSREVVLDTDNHDKLFGSWMRKSFVAPEGEDTALGLD